jgi:hypothetical protein
LQEGDLAAELLFAPQLHGNLYLHGILVRTISDRGDRQEQPLCFGVNFTGFTTTMETYFALNRDRTNTKVPELLCWLLPHVIQLLDERTRNSPQLWCAVAHLYDALSKDLQVLSLLSFSHKLQGTALEAYKTMAILLAQLLRPAAGLAAGSMPHSFPCAKGASEADMSELRLLGLAPIKVRRCSH